MDRHAGHRRRLTSSEAGMVTIRLLPGMATDAAAQPAQRLGHPPAGRRLKILNAGMGCFGGLLKKGDLSVCLLQLRAQLAFAERGHVMRLGEALLRVVRYGQSLLRVE